MRSRPKVKLLLDSSVITPGEKLVAEAVLSSTSETPVDYVRLRLQGIAKDGVGQGKYRSTYETVFYEREWKSGSMKMPVGEHKFPATFDIDVDAPPTYLGQDASIAYTMTVHVAIPWWPDREAHFGIPVVLAPAPSPAPLPMTFATSPEGPRGTDPFMEIALDTTQIALGDVVSGSVSVQNLRGKRIRGIDLAFVETETITLPKFDVREGKRFRLRVHDGAPVEGEAIPFRVRLPENATITPRVGGRVATPFRVSTHIEVSADVVWGSNIVVRAPVVVFPKATAPRASTGWVAPVGKERQLLVWQSAATKLGLIVMTDRDELRMTGQRGVVTIEIDAEHSANDFWLIAKLGWPNLGLDLDVSERKWSDALAVNIVKTGDERMDGRLCAHAREHAQAKQSIILPDVMATVMEFEEVKIDDLGAKLSLRGAPHVTEKVEPFVAKVFAAAEAFDVALRSIPAPALFASDVSAWQALAARLRGRLELGRMWIHEAQVGTDACEIGSMWARGGLHLGSTVRVAIDPPLEKPPTAIEDPALSPAARDAWRELLAKSKSVTIEAKAISIEIEGKLADPQVAMPILELAVTLRRALGGTIAAGPFR